MFHVILRVTENGNDKDGKMNKQRVGYMNNKVCETCGNGFYGQRSTAKFCSVACRVATHRASKRTADVVLAEVMPLLSELGSMVSETGDWDAVVALIASMKQASFQAALNPSSWWRCSECYKTIQKECPSSSDCSCGDTAKWKLQKRMI